jgi:hypothetical protein
MPSQSKKPAKAVKTSNREAIEYLAQIATAIEGGIPVGELIYESNKDTLAKHLRRGVVL